MTSKEIERIVDKEKEGHLFILNDFLDLTNYECAKKIIQRLVERKKLEKVLDGIYMKPKYSTYLNSYIPCNMYDLAECIARKYGWDIVPTGEIAINYYGLSTQLPSKYLYSSTGPYRKYNVNGNEISFKHTSNKKMSNMSKKVQYLIQAISNYGKNNFEDKSKKKLVANVDEFTLDEALEQAKLVDNWIYELIKELKEMKIIEKNS